MVAGFVQYRKVEQAIEMCQEMMDRGQPRLDAAMANIEPAMSNESGEDVSVGECPFTQT